MKAKNFEEVRNIAHSLKGASGNISAKQLRETFFKLEEMGKVGKLDGAEGYLSAMDAQFERFQKRTAEVKKEYQG